MPISHLLLIFVVILAWGCNFIFVKLGINEMPPLLLCGLRFFLASVPAIFFIKPPKAPFKIIVLYGFLMFGLQFALLFMGMKAGMPPGLASILMQVQVFFSILFAVIFLREKIGFWQIVGGLVSFSGITLIATHHDKNVSLLGFLLIISAAATWGVGNLISKKISHVNMMSLVVWGSFVACFPMLLLSLTFEGINTILLSYHHITWVGISSLLYIVYISTWVGYGVWNWLLSRYPVSMVVPFTLLIPIIGMLSSIIIIGESFQLWKIAAGLLVITGIGIHLFGARFLVRKKRILLNPE